MGKGINDLFSECLNKGKIKEFSDGPRLVQKELTIAEKDLYVAKQSMKNSNWKWSTIQSYYSMFHTARALIFSRGYREKSHRCLRIAVDFLFVNQGVFSEKFINAFQTAKIMRENADYEENYSEKGARKLITVADEFLETAADQLLQQ